MPWKCCFLLCGLAAATLRAQTIPIVIAPFTTIAIPPGQVSSPLSVSLRNQVSYTPDAGVTVLYSNDSTILFLSASQSVTDASGDASIWVIGLGAGVAHVTASIPGSEVVFTVTVIDPGSTAVPEPATIGRIVWQGSSTMVDRTPFVGTVWQSGVRDPGAAVSVAVTQGPAELLNGAGAVVDELSLVTQGDGTLAFDAQFPTDGSSPDDFSIITMTVQDGDSAVFLVHALPPGTPPIVQVTGLGNQVFPLVDGSPSPIPVTLALHSSAGTPLAGVTVAITPATDSQASCGVTVAITGTDGTFPCHLMVQGSEGMGSLGFVLGGMTVSPSIAYRVGAASPGLIRLLSGNFQGGPSGYLLPVPLTVQVLDAFGNALPATPIVWQSGTATLVTASAVTDGSGIASATVEMGSQPGLQTVSVGTAGLSAQFQLTDSSLGQMTATSGGGQIAKLDQTFGRPLAVRVTDAAGEPLAGRAVFFSVLKGAATVADNVVATGADGMASVNVKAGAMPGPVSVEASTNGDRIDFALATLPSAAESVTVSDWNGRQSALTPGALMTVSFVSAGRNGYEAMSYATPPYPTSVEGAAVSFNDVPAPILRLSNSGNVTALLVQIPWELKGQETANLLLSTSDGATVVPDLPVEDLHPVFHLAPAALSRSLTLQITGLGQLAPLANTNSAGLPGQTVSTPFSLSIDRIPLPILNVAADPTLVGVADVTVAIPIAARWRLRSPDEISVAFGENPQPTAPRPVRPRTGTTRLPFFSNAQR